jgi:hypothetical protein
MVAVERFGKEIPGQIRREVKSLRLSSGRCISRDKGMWKCGK